MSEGAAQPLLIASAPNGARRTRRDHPALPVTAAQLADTAAQVVQVGARMLHLHVRDERGRHTLDAAAYRAAVGAIRARTGDALFIQLTSESAGCYSAAFQREAIAGFCFHDSDSDSGADGVSIAPRELIREPGDAAPAKELFHRLHAQRVLIQYILYSHDDIAHYHALLEDIVIPAGGHSLLLVVGRRNSNGDADTPGLLQQMIDALSGPAPWMVCAFGAGEFDCLRTAAERGGHVRIGFENSLNLQSGAQAEDNRALIAQFIAAGNPQRRPLADARETRRILGAET